MAYKGNDLDLRPARPAPIREPAAPAERAADPARPHPAGINGPIDVDETVLATCNSAYDVAQFHGADAVRLEHLLHAFTRIPAGAEALEGLGIRVDKLRRHTAALIAAEMPTGPLDPHGMPRASPALADALRQAAEHAARRRAAASLHDLVRTVLCVDPQSPAAALLMEAAADPQRLERWRDEPRRETPGSAALLAEPQSALAHEALREHLAQLEAAVRSLRTEVAADCKAVGDFLREARSDLQALRGEPGRAAHVEAALQALREEIAEDRRALLDLLGETRSELQALRADAGRSAGTVGTEAVEALIDTKLGHIGTAAASLAERLPAIDKLAQAGDVREEAIAGRMEAHAQGIAEKVAGSIAARFAEAEAAVRRLQEDTERRLSSSGERQIALEASVRAQLQSAEDAGKTHERDLAEIHQALLKLGASQQTLGENFAAWRGESAGDIGIVSNRLQQLEHTMLDLLGQLGTELQTLRQESTDTETRRGNGFKRWLYGTSSVFAGRREEAGAASRAPERPEGGQPS